MERDRRRPSSRAHLARLEQQQQQPARREQRGQPEQPPGFDVREAAWAAADLVPGMPITSGAGSGALTLIQRQTLAAPVATVTFSAIPQSFDSLLFIVTSRDDSVAGITTLNYRINQQAGGIYYNQRLRGSAAAASASESLAQTMGVCGLNTSDFNAASTVPGISRILVPQAAGSTWNKLSIGETFAINSSLSGGMVVESFASFCASSQAITRWDFFANAGGANFKTGSVFTLYGTG